MAAIFKVGDRIALPQVGLGTVAAVGPASFQPGREFYEIRPDRQASTIYIPTDINPSERGLRSMMTAREAREVLEVLTQGQPTPPDSEWRRALRDRVRAGGVVEQAALVRDLCTRTVVKRLSTQEKAFYDKALEALVEEMSEALTQSHEEVRAQVDKALAAACDGERAKASS